MLRRLMFFNRRSRTGDKRDDEFPTRQLFILALCRICEPIAFMSIFPYVYFMISSFNITSDDRQISIYAGMVTSAFAFAEFSTGALWGRLSDVVGRKPILLTGLAGTGISMIVFGFAQNLHVALLARALGGLLNGNIGVLQTTVAEVVKVKKHQPRAYAIMPFVWCLGSIIGSGLGGSLAEPVKNYPTAFAAGSIFEKYPFLLPNIICAMVVLCGLTVGILFLEETHEQKKSRRDYGLELGDWILSKVVGKIDDDYEYSKFAEATSPETAALIQNGSPGYISGDSTPHESCTPRHSIAESTIETSSLEDDIEAPKPRHPMLKAFNKQVVLHVVAYGVLAFHSISFEQLLPVLLSAEPSDEPVSLPFKFEGGFGLPSRTIGFILSLQGVYQMVAQMVIFPFVVRKFGALCTFRTVAILWVLLYLTVPYLVLLPDALRMPGLAVVLIWKVTFQSLSYPTNALLLANSAPSLLVLGAINGVAASAASLGRAFGPTISGFIQSAGSRIGYSGLAWWVCALISLAGALQSWWMTEPAGRPDLEQSEENTTESRQEPLNEKISLEISTDRAPAGQGLDEATIHTVCVQPKI